MDILGGTRTANDQGTPSSALSKRGKAATSTQRSPGRRMSQCSHRTLEEQRGLPPVDAHHTRYSGRSSLCDGSQLSTAEDAYVVQRSLSNCTGSHVDSRLNGSTPISRGNKKLVAPLSRACSQALQDGPRVSARSRALSCSADRVTRGAHACVWRYSRPNVCDQHENGYLYMRERVSVCGMVVVNIPGTVSSL